MTDHGAGAGDEVDVGVGEPYPMADGELRAEQAQVGEMPHSRRPGTPLRVFLLIRRFEHVHVQPDTIGLGIIPQGVQGVIRAPVQVRWGELNACARAALPAFPELRERWQSRARTRIQLAPANLHWCSDDALHALRDYAQTYRVGLHMHVLETPYQQEYAQRRTGTTAVRHLADLGLLGPQLTIGHGVWLTDADIDLVASTGTMVCHNASSNLRLRSGVAPLNPLLACGVRVALGLDEAGINDDRDMLQEMRLVLRLHCEPGMDDRVPTAAQD